MSPKDTTGGRIETDGRVEPADDRSTGFPRRTILKAGALAMSAFGAIAPATARDSRAEKRAVDYADGGTETEDDAAVDEPEGFAADALVKHATFADDVSMSFTMTYTEGEMGTREVEVDDGASVIVGEVTWEPGGTSGWHTHPGPVIVCVAEGEIELVNEDDCVARTYSAGDAFAAQGQGNVHVARNPSDTDGAVAYVTWLGVPDGEPGTVWVEPPGC